MSWDPGKHPRDPLGKFAAAVAHDTEARRSVSAARHRELATQNKRAAKLYETGRAHDPSGRAHDIFTAKAQLHAIAARRGKKRPKPKAVAGAKSGSGISALELAGRRVQSNQRAANARKRAGF